MAVVRSLGALADTESLGWMPTSSYGTMRLYNDYIADYATIYRTQPNVRTCVDFLARNVAQLGLHVFRRVSDTDRERLQDHPLARLLAQPLPPAQKLTRYRLIETLISDLGVYFRAYWLKVRREDQGLMGLLPLPPQLVEDKGVFYPTGYELSVGGQLIKLGVDEVVHFRGYNPGNRASGLSPLETLRRVLAEEQAMGDYREGFWRNSARIRGIIERPADAPPWSQTAQERFLADFAALYSGSENSGKTPVLEDGMQWKEAAFNAQESEYLAGRRLTREECARAYHIPLPMVGILDHATYSNVREMHKHLYQDSLGPWLAMIEQEIELQLLSELADAEGVYVEFNIAEKLAGSFEEQTQALQSAVGRPWMTADEARGRLNLPSLGGDAGRLVTPLNVLVGGQASPRDSVAPPKGLTPETKAVGDVDVTRMELRERHRAKWREEMERYFRRQERAILSRSRATSAGELWVDMGRWNTELQTDLYRLNAFTAGTWGDLVAEGIGGEWERDWMDEYLLENARIAAEEINAATKDATAEAWAGEDRLQGLRDVFALAIGARAAEIAVSKVTTAANFGSQEAAKQLRATKKTWRTNSANPRSSHAAMNGQTVPLGDKFSNGMRWPGDTAGGADEVAGCECSLVFGR